MNPYPDAADRLMLEILETDEIRTEVDVRTELLRFKQLGVSLAEDDLGAGYSSLIRLRELPFDAIKIDRSIVAHIDHDASDVLRFTLSISLPAWGTRWARR